MKEYGSHTDMRNSVLSDYPRQLLYDYNPLKSLEDWNTPLTVMIRNSKMLNYLQKITYQKTANEYKIGYAGSEYDTAKPSVHNFSDYTMENLSLKCLWLQEIHQSSSFKNRGSVATYIEKEKERDSNLH